MVIFSRQQSLQLRDGVVTEQQLERRCERSSDSVLPLTMPLPAENEEALTATRSSLLGALVVAARHRGLHLNAPELARDYRLGPGEPSLD